MSVSRRLVAVASSASLVAVGLTLAVAAPSSSQEPLCDKGDSVTLIISNGKKQSFQCEDTSGPLTQAIVEKNPWVNAESPALMKTPTAELVDRSNPAAPPEGAQPQIFTGNSQGAGVRSSADPVGEERDSVSRGETITFAQADVPLARTFGSLDLEVNVVSPVTIVAQALDGNGDPIVGAVDDETFTATGPGVASFFQDTVDDQVSARGFTLSVEEDGEFEILATGQTQFNFFAKFNECELGIGVGEVPECVVTFEDITLKAVFTGDPFKVRVEIDPTVQECGAVTPIVEDNDYQLFQVFCERPINYDADLKGQVANDVNGDNYTPLPDCAVDDVDTTQTVDKQSCILEASWTSEALPGGDGLRDFTAKSWADGDPFYK